MYMSSGVSHCPQVLSTRKLPFLANENKLLENSFQAEDFQKLKYISVFASGQAKTEFWKHDAGTYIY